MSIIFYLSVTRSIQYSVDSSSSILHIAAGAVGGQVSLLAFDLYRFLGTLRDDRPPWAVGTATDVARSGLTLLSRQGLSQSLQTSSRCCTGRRCASRDARDSGTGTTGQRRSSTAAARRASGGGCSPW